MGSSPRLRGTPQCRLSRPLSIGIIPALAGNTTGCVVWATYPWDHPRACGEHFPVGQPERGRQGSSPRLRGTRAGYSDHYGFLGIIPALAGNTGNEKTNVFRARDHPRACGEHYPQFFSAIEAMGSSPRLRGTQNQRARLHCITGIIPALAGNTSPFPPTRFSPRDHPRACGEHQIITPVMVELAGSSPRLRGTHSP